MCEFYIYILKDIYSMSHTSSTSHIFYTRISQTNNHCALTWYIYTYIYKVEQTINNCLKRLFHESKKDSLPSSIPRSNLKFLKAYLPVCGSFITASFMHWKSIQSSDDALFGWYNGLLAKQANLHELVQVSLGAPFIGPCATSKEKTL